MKTSLATSIIVAVIVQIVVGLLATVLRSEFNIFDSVTLYFVVLLFLEMLRRGKYD